MLARRKGPKRAVYAALSLKVRPFFRQPSLGAFAELDLADHDPTCFSFSPLFAFL